MSILSKNLIFGARDLHAYVEEGLHHLYTQSPDKSVKREAGWNF